MKLPQTMITWVESQVNSCLVPFFVKSFFLNLGMAYLVFFLGTKSHIMALCVGFPFFDFF
jgi:hypothetical protein